MKKFKSFSKIISMLIVFAMVLGMVQISLPTNVEAATIETASDLLLYPAPRNLTAGSGKLTLTNGYIESDNTSLKAIDKIYNSALDLAGVNLKDSTGSAVVKIKKDDTLNEQGYSLVIAADGITISYKDEPGAYYAAATLYQILWQSKNELPCLTIENDYPDFKYRAFDIDISRNRTPKLETLKHVVDIMDMLKFNQFFMYLEGYSYAYESYPDAWENSVPLTPAEIRELSNYCKARGIELIPAQNSLGHSAKVVSTYPELGDTATGQVLNVFKPETQEYLSNIYDDLYKGFDTDYLQIGCDETTFNLTSGTAAASWEELNPGKEATQKDVYFDSVKKVYDIAESKGKKVYMWADKLISNWSSDFDSCAYAKELMPNMIAMNWSYYVSTDRFDYSSRYLSNAGVPFYICPGDQSWSTIVGDAPTLKENARYAAVKGKQYGAIGYCMTNWGDGGHYQNLVTSYPGITYAGGLSWCYDTNVEGTNSYDEFINMFIYQDTTNTVSQAFSKVTEYKTDYKISYDLHTPKVMMNDTWNNLTSSTFLWKLINTIADTSPVDQVERATIDETERAVFIEKFDELSARIDAFLTVLENSNMQAEDKDLYYKELKNTMQTLKLTADYAVIRAKLLTGGDITEPLATMYELSDDIDALAKDFAEVVEDFRYIWGDMDLVNNLSSTILQFRNISTFLKTQIGARNIYEAQDDGNLFLMTPDTIESIPSAASGLAGAKNWLNSGAYIPNVAVSQIGGTTVQQLKDVSADAIYVTEDAGKKIFTYDTGAVINGGYYSTDTDGGTLMPIVGFPAHIPADGNYTFTAKAKYKSGQAVSADTVSFSGYANKVSNANATVNLGEAAALSVSTPDSDGWYTVTATFSATDSQAGAFNILPASSITDDTLYVADYVLKCDEVTNAVISTLHSKEVTVRIGDELTVPTATTNGKEAITVKVKNPAGTETTVNMGDTLTFDTAGEYTITYSAADAGKSLTITVTVEYIYQNLLDLVNRIEAMDLSLYTDDTVAAVNTEIAEAKALMADENTTKEAFDTAYDELDAARKALKFKRAFVSSDKITVTSNASVYSNNYLSNAVDGDVNTVAYLAKYQTVGDYIQFAFSETVKLDGIQIINNQGNDYLTEGEIQVSADGSSWTTVGAVANAADQTINFDAVDANYARIVCTKDARYWWKLSEAKLYYEVPEAVDENNYIVSGMKIVKAKTEDVYGNAYDSTYPAVNMIDGKTDTMGANAYYYKTAGAASKTLTVIDLGDYYELKAVEITVPTSTQIEEAFTAVSPVSTYRRMNYNGGGIYVSNSIPAYTDFSDFNVASTSTATDLVRLTIGGNSLSSGNWDPETRGATCNELESGMTYRYLSIWTPNGGGHALNEIKVKIVADETPAPVPDTDVEISNLTADASGNVSVAIANAPTDATVYVASYDVNGSLLEVHKVTLTDGAASEKFNTTDVKQYKAFVWEGYEPLTKAKELDV